MLEVSVKKPLTRRRVNGSGGAIVMAALLMGGCKNESASPVAAAPETQASSTPAVVSPASHRAPGPQGPGGVVAAIGRPAPDFALDDLEGKQVKLADFAGKTVVLEWFNPECPFVKASHGKGSLKGLAEKYDGKHEVVWLAINSAGPGRQGHGVEKNLAGKQSFELTHPVLLDESGSIGKRYGATNTPHLFIIDKQGKLVYRGAIDNSPDGEGESPSGGRLINYVSQALDELRAGKPVSVPETKAYGCSVKYQGS